MSIAMVIFVKTPEFSPVKTRLAASIGTSSAKTFYIKSLLATAEVVKKIRDTNNELVPYWAVAENEAMNSELWSDFECIYQGEGKLGERLSKVYSELIKKFNIVCFIGADSPHVTYKQYNQSISKISQKSLAKFIIGNTLDGGFYFFAGKENLEKEVWTSVEYSSDKTSKMLCENLFELGLVEYTESSFDVDEIIDLQRFKEINFNSGELLPEQKALIAWSRTIC